MLGRLRPWLTGTTLLLIVLVCHYCLPEHRARDEVTRLRKRWSHLPVRVSAESSCRTPRHGAKKEECASGRRRRRRLRSGLPAKGLIRSRIDKEEYQRLRDEYFGILRGVDPGCHLTPAARAARFNKWNFSARQSLKPPSSRPSLMHSHRFRGMNWTDAVQMAKRKISSDA